MSTPAKRHSLRLAMRLLLPAAACITTAAHAEEIEIDAAPFPQQAYPGDHVAVPLLGGGACNAAAPDPERQPQIRLTEHFPNDAANPNDDVYVYAVDYWLINDPFAACGTPPPPPFFYANVGVLPNGSHRFDVTGQLDGEQHVSYQTVDAWVFPHERPRDNITGIWFAPEQSGRGFTVMRSGNMFALYWATHDAEGQPTWATLLLPDTTVDDDADQNTFSGTAINTSGSPLTGGAASLVDAPWAKVKFTYEGCGRATFEWGALDPPIGQQPEIDPDIGEGSLTLVQVLVPDGVETCDAVALSDGLVAEWVEPVPSK